MVCQERKKIFQNLVALKSRRCSVTSCQPRPPPIQRPKRDSFPLGCLNRNTKRFLHALSFTSVQWPDISCFFSKPVFHRSLQSNRNNTHDETSNHPDHPAFDNRTMRLPCDGPRQLFGHRFLHQWRWRRDRVSTHKFRDRGGAEAFGAIRRAWPLHPVRTSAVRPSGKRMRRPSRGQLEKHTTRKVTHNTKTS